MLIREKRHRETWLWANTAVHILPKCPLLTWVVGVHCVTKAAICKKNVQNIKYLYKFWN